MIKLLVTPLMLLCLSCEDRQAEAQNLSHLANSQPALLKAHRHSSNTSNVLVIYAWNNRADVYDLVNKRGNVRSKNRLDRATEFGGPLHFCDTESLHCLRSYLEIVVPRKFPFPPHWSNAGYECRQIYSEANASGVVKAECRFRTDSATIFEYSPVRGVLRYRRICPGCDDGSYELLSERGLFPAS